MPGKKNTFQRRTQYTIQARSDCGRMSHYHGLCRLLRGIAEITRYPGSGRLLKPYEVTPMRTVQRITATILLILFILHGILGATSMTGISNIGLYPMLIAFLLFLGLHILCGLYYVIRSLKGPGKHYFKLNRKLWLRRISGLLLWCWPSATHICSVSLRAWIFKFNWPCTRQLIYCFYWSHIFTSAIMWTRILLLTAHSIITAALSICLFLSVFFAYFTFANLYFYFS